MFCNRISDDILNAIFFSRGNTNLRVTVDFYTFLYVVEKFKKKSNIRELLGENENLAEKK